MLAMPLKRSICPVNGFCSTSLIEKLTMKKPMSKAKIKMIWMILGILLKTQNLNQSILLGEGFLGGRLKTISLIKKELLR